MQALRALAPFLCLNKANNSAKLQKIFGILTILMIFREKVLDISLQSVIFAQFEMHDAAPRECDAMIYCCYDR